jgi:hypothetical protein
MILLNIVAAYDAESKYSSSVRTASPREIVVRCSGVVPADVIAMRENMREVHA